MGTWICFVAFIFFGPASFTCLRGAGPLELLPRWLTSHRCRKGLHISEVQFLEDFEDSQDEWHALLWFIDTFYRSGCEITLEVGTSRWQFPHILLDPALGIQGRQLCHGENDMMC